MERQDYPAMLPQLQPSQAVDVLNDRVRQVGRLNTAIADWLAARRQLEEQYSLGLRRLAQRPLDVGDLGVFSVPWTAITGSADTIADTHASLAARIELEIEQPLRDFNTRNREMTSMGNIQGNLAALAKELDKAQQKADKLRGKGDRAEAGKVANASAEVTSAQAQWDSQAPYVFESLQLLDETRVNHLRDLLTQFETMENDGLDKSRTAAEQCLNMLLNVQTEDEIKTFVLKTAQGRPSLTRAQRPSASTPSRGASSSGAGPGLSPIVSRPEDERRSTRSGSVQEATTDEKPSKSRLGGLKRFGTVIAKRRESRMPSTLPATSESPERKNKSSPFGRLGRSKDSSSNLGTVDEPPTSQRPPSPLRLGSEIFQSPSERDVPDPMSAAGGALQLSLGNGSMGATTTTSTGLPNGSHQTELQPTVSPSSEQQRDREGFSVPPRHVDPITQAQLEAGLVSESPTPQFNVNIRDAPIADDSANDDAALASVANKLQAPPTTSRRSNTVRGRRGDRNSSAVNSIFIPTEQQIAELAPDSSEVVTSQPPSQPPIQTTAPAPAPVPVEPSSIASPSSASGLGVAGVTAGIAGLATAAGIAAMTSSPLTPPAEQQPSSPLRPDSRRTTGIDPSRSDAHSIRSATTSGSQGGTRHPELAGSGLNTSIIETIGARFENGTLTSSTLIGEVALAFNATDPSSPSSTQNIRLDNFSVLEKVAPNPAFIDPVPNREGEYTVNLASIAKTQIAFKYQVGSESSSAPPLVLSPAFQIKPTQTSVIITYSPNPALTSPVTLTNVGIALTLEGARVTACQSKPVGTFARERNVLFWHLPEVILTPGEAGEKLLGRFVTDGEAKSGSVEARWEITGTQSLGSGLGISMQAAADGADPFADEDGAGAISPSATGVWKEVPAVKKIVSGVYVAK